MDRLDKKILRLLQEDATLAVADVAKRVGLSTTPCWRRIQRLEEDGVIMRRVAVLDPEKINARVSVFVAIRTNVHLDHILFGNMLGVGPQDLWTAGSIGLVVSVALLLKWRDLMLHAFDPIQARAAGLRVGVLHYGLLTILSLTIVATLSATGLILAVGLLIAPGAIAFLLVRSFGHMLVVAVAACMVGMLGGVYLSFFLDSAPAPTIVLILTAIFLVAFVRRQVLTRRVSATA